MVNNAMPIKLGIHTIKIMDIYIKDEPNFKNRPEMLRFLVNKYHYDMQMAKNDGKKK